MLFQLIYIVHILFWLFILTAFLDKKLAYYNIYYVIPITYILHILPFHILMKLKKEIDPKNHKLRAKEIDEQLIIPKYFVDIQDKLEKECTFSPISPQGMLIFGLLSSIYVLYPIKYL